MISAPDDRLAPGQSKRRPRPAAPPPFAGPLTTVSTSAVAATPTGMLAKKTERHPSSLTSTPPIIGPVIEPVPMIAVYIPTALPRSRAGNASRIMAMPLAWIPAAPTPWSIFGCDKQGQGRRRAGERPPRRRTRRSRRCTPSCGW